MAPAPATAGGGGIETIDSRRVRKEKIAYTRSRVKRLTRTRAVTFRAFPAQVERWWFEAAAKDGMSFSAWLAQTLDAAVAATAR